MRDIPMFTTENGVAGLVLCQIPYRQTAYVTIHASSEPAALIGECLQFCRAAGAERIFATGHSYLETFPLHSCIIKMQVNRSALGETDTCVFPVTNETLDSFRHFYNEKMLTVDHASFMTEADAKKFLSAGTGYFIHRNGVFLGIGVGEGSTLHTVAAAVPGVGAELIRAMQHVLSGDVIDLEVASTNQRAIRLYERIGFCATGESIRWYQIL